MKNFDIEEFAGIEDVDVAEYVQRASFTLTKEKRQISQAQRNALRERLILMTAEVLADEFDIEGVETDDGYMLEIQSDQLGVIAVELALKIKNLNYEIPYND